MDVLKHYVDLFNKEDEELYREIKQTHGKNVFAVINKSDIAKEKALPFASPLIVPSLRPDKEKEKKTNVPGLRT